jgi:hypothetical protein
MCLTGTPCGSNGEDLGPGVEPPHAPQSNAKVPNDDWSPFETRVEFEVADFLYRRNQMPATQIDHLMDVWAASLGEGESPPYSDHDGVYEAIDSIPLGDARWESFTVTYTGARPSINIPPWMEAGYEIWYRSPHTIIRNQLANPDFEHEIDYAPKQVFDSEGEREYSDLMTGNWSWQQAVC